MARGRRRPNYYSDDDDDDEPPRRSKPKNDSFVRNALTGLAGAAALGVTGHVLQKKGLISGVAVGKLMSDIAAGSGTFGRRAMELASDIVTGPLHWAHKQLEAETTDNLALLYETTEEALEHTQAVEADVVEQNARITALVASVGELKQEVAAGGSDLAATRTELAAKTRELHDMINGVSTDANEFGHQLQATLAASNGDIEEVARAVVDLRRRQEAIADVAAAQSESTMYIPGTEGTKRADRNTLPGDPGNPATSMNQDPLPGQSISMWNGAASLDAQPRFKGPRDLEPTTRTKRMAGFEEEDHLESVPKRVSTRENVRDSSKAPRRHTRTVNETRGPGPRHLRPAGLVNFDISQF